MDCQIGTLRWVAVAIKSFALATLPGLAAADARMACPPLDVVLTCPAEGAQINLQAGKDAPAGLSYIIAPQIAGASAQTLGAGQSIILDVAGQMGQQIVLALVGLEPAGGKMASCCMSNQRVSLPATCPAPGGVGTVLPAPQVPDVAVVIAPQGACTRASAAPQCKARLQVTSDIPDDALQQVTLTAQAARTLSGQGIDCTRMAGGQAICALPAGRAFDLDIQLAPATPRGQTPICARLGIAEDDQSRTLALQLALTRAGYDLGQADGRLGPRTMTALTRFIADAGLPPLQDEIPPEALAILGLLPAPDRNAGNNQSCAALVVPAAPLICDTATARAKGGVCACRFPGMQRVSDTACACRKGQVLGAKGCTDRPRVTVKTTPKPANKLQCDNPTVIARDGACACRYKNSVMAKNGICLCKSGLPPLPGLGCSVTFSIDIAPGGNSEEDAP